MLRPELSNVRLPLLLLAVTCLGGCADSDWAQVSGTVSLNGNPVGPGSIMFEPVTPETALAPSGMGTFNEDGRYSLRSAGGRDGLPPGEYLVMIDGRAKESSGDEYIDPNQKSAIPAKYMNPNASGLKASVEPGANTLDFDLKP